MRPEPSRPRKKGAKDKGERDGEFDDEGLSAPPDFTPRFMPMIRKITRFLSPRRLQAAQKRRLMGWYALLKRYRVETKFISAPPATPGAALKPDTPKPPPPPSPMPKGGGKKRLGPNFNRPSGPRR